MNSTIIIPNGSSIIIENPLIHLLGLLVIPIISIAAVIVVGFLSWNYSKKQHEREAMQYVFELLQASGHKGAEQNIRDKYKEGRIKEIIANFGSDPASVVERNYDQVGAMISNNLVPFEQYCISFGVLTVVSYFILKDIIKKEREEHKYHMAYFTNLAIDCFKFWNEQKEELRPIIDTPKKEPITIQMLGDKIALPKKRRLSFLRSSKFYKRFR